MKTDQQKKGAVKQVTAGKPGSPVQPGTVLQASGAIPIESTKTESGFGSPTRAVWDRYIDSRMKHFGTR